MGLGREGVQGLGVTGLPAAHERLLPWSSGPLTGIGVGVLSPLDGNRPSLSDMQSPWQSTGGHHPRGWERQPCLPPEEKPHLRVSRCYFNRLCLSQNIRWHHP